ncbi:MAG: hypothetical protein KKD73_05110 [Proteobacteria bacterium]|nr:hypothetical protein [Pseudomonadota bacterium]MBU1639044.1 hypothetical protein [Pseudomonadota bacterium]
MDEAKINGISEGLPLIQYAVEGPGLCRRIESADTGTVDVVNRQAWEVIERQVFLARAQVLAGKASVLLYYMTANQMDPALLAKFMGIARWRVKRHLKPRVFSKLRPQLLAGYAALFKIREDELRQGLFLSAVYEKGQ